MSNTGADWGDAEWGYCLWSGDNPDPKQLADVATALLTGRAELGDLLWYAAAVATACRLDLEDIAEANLRRTRDRYPRQRMEAECGNQQRHQTSGTRQRPNMVGTSRVPDSG